MRKIIILLMSLSLIFGSLNASFCDGENVDLGSIKVKAVPSISNAQDGDHITFEFRVVNLPTKSNIALKAMAATISYDDDILEIVEYKKGTNSRDGFSFDKGSFKLSAFKDSDVVYVENEVLFSMEMKVKEGTDAKSCSLKIDQLLFFDDNENGKPITAITSYDSVNLIKSWDSYVLKGTVISALPGANQTLEIYVGDNSVYLGSLSTANDRTVLDNEGINLDMTKFTSTSKSISELNFSDIPVISIKSGTMIYKKKLSASDLKIDDHGKYYISLGDIILIQGNVNKDMSIDMNDVDLLTKKVGSNTSDRDLDINLDGKIDIKDLFYISKSYGY